ncbi:hypothetical protein [Acidipila sp. EB88]|uniref:hypothetical protein n=1 Tax=Acidipila sp. EB88 TaxID=2305226 RepID=UPI000F5F1288|nr:hypothetical protein [Acidipila sp. EB88]RRA48906.1 hypothetical protein D1Y84_12070 [Acidipila sp. EB88]
MFPTSCNAFSFPAAVLLCLASAPSLRAQWIPDTPPATLGVVTLAGTPEHFQVEGKDVLCGARTTTVRVGEHLLQPVAGCTQMLLGQDVKIFGKSRKHGQEIEAAAIEVDYARQQRVSGLAIIDALPADAHSNWTFRADGYRIRVTPATRCSFDGPLAGPDGMRTNVWVEYSGRQERDGTVVADTADFVPNTVEPLEAKIRAKWTFDPAATTEENRQNYLSKSLVGLNAKRIPAYGDAAMQARVAALGARLIPAYQQALPESDPTKIHFLFQVVDERDVRDAMTLPNGIILVPYQVVARLRSDAQLAAVLADNIAGALEKQTLRQIPAAPGIVASRATLTAAGVFIPLIGLAASADHGISAAAVRHAEEQRGRVSLALMRDAGFDATEAPVAWWLLASPKDKDVQQIAMPGRARYLYQELAATWPPA